MIITDIKDLIGVFGNFKQINGMPETNDDGFTFMGEKVKIVFESKKHPSGVISRKDRIVNISEDDITITSAACRFVFNGGEHEV